MQRLFEVPKDEQQEADRVLDTYLKKRVREMIYQSGVDCVKMYYWLEKDEVIDDTLAHPIELEYNQYIKRRLQ
jgi:hypothetical protein